jgi:flagellar export protein FliJ
VLKVREYAEQAAEAGLAVKSAVCARLNLVLEENARATLLASRERFRPGSVAADHRSAELYAVRLGSEREKLLKALAFAEVEREEARKVYVAARIAKKLVEKLREREESAYYKAVSREEIKTMDDLAAGARMRFASASRKEIAG